MGTVGGDAVYQAVREGNVDVVRTYLEAGGDADASNPATGRTLLHTASRQGFPAIASLLLSKGANPGATTLRHLTPLHLACHQGHLKVARLLLEAWAPVDDRDEAGTSPLHLAAQMGHEDVVRLLMQCGAEKDAGDESGWTPMFFAAWKGHAAVTRVLLQAGANARVVDQRDKITALHLACSWGQLEVAKVLIEFGADSSAKDCNGDFPERVIGAGDPHVEAACARELSELVIGHRMRIRGASSSLECVVDSLRAKVSELEDQLARAGRDHLVARAYILDANRAKFAAALKPECPVCQVEVKEAVLDPCRHLAACASCAVPMESCSLCSCPVQGFEILEGRRVYEHVSALEDEAAGLRAQLKRFSLRVRDLVAANGDLKLEVQRAKAEISVLNEERKGLGEGFWIQSPSPPLTPPAGDSTTGTACEDLGAVPSLGPAPSAKEPACGGGENTHGKNSVSGDGGIHELSWVQRDGGVNWVPQDGALKLVRQIGDDERSREAQSAVGTPCTGAGLGGLKAVILDHTTPNDHDVSGHSGSRSRLVGPGDDGKVRSAGSGPRSAESIPDLKFGGDRAMADDSHDEHPEFAGRLAYGLGLIRASVRSGGGTPRSESESSSSDSSIGSCNERHVVGAMGYLERHLSVNSPSSNMRKKAFDSFGSTSSGGESRGQSMSAG